MKLPSHDEKFGGAPRVDADGNPMDPRDKSRKTDPGPGPRPPDGQGIVSLPSDGLTEGIDSEWGAESDATPVWPTPPGILALARTDTHPAPEGR